MKRILSFIAPIFFTSVISSQELAQVTFSNSSHLSYFSFLTNGNVLVRVSAEGNILEWGTEVQSIRSSEYYAPGLQPYLGRVEYYGKEADSVFRGKVKSIGTATITYYGYYEALEKAGKIRTIGTLVFDYFDQFADKAFRGKMKFAGRLPIEYFSSFEEELQRGKLKSVSNSAITYYSFFDDKLIRGKIKSIGAVNYSWYTSLDAGRGGGLKSGSYRQNIAGITYIIW
ncbi:MAG TPA: hypothetical protein VN451_10520 [Chitinophagaceae bacterium]|nr:hypothetical protein [Chitinophagaceae bacterium]